MTPVSIMGIYCEVPWQSVCTLNSLRLATASACCLAVCNLHTTPPLNTLGAFTLADIDVKFV